MAEVYTNTYAIIDLEITDSRGNLVDPIGDVNVEVFDYDVYNEQTGDSGAVVDEGVASQTLYGSAPATGRFEYELTPEITSEPKTLRITWTYSLDAGEGQERSNSKEIFVSVPYATLSRLREIKELNEYSDQEIMAMERLVARVIDSYCGQSFGFEIDKIKTVVGDASEYLILPSRLWKLNDLSVLDDHERIIRDNLGNILDVDISGRSVLEYVTVDVDNPWRIRNKRSYNNITMDETRTKSFFKNGNIYAVRGNWATHLSPRGLQKRPLYS
jgi:hypothetical protein